MSAPRSGCPINLTVETLGDRWSLIVIRDLTFGNRRHFRELLTRSEEGMASNIPADRLTRLEKAGLVSRRDDCPGWRAGLLDVIRYRADGSVLGEVRAAPGNPPNFQSIVPDTAAAGVANGICTFVRDILNQDHRPAARPAWRKEQ